MFYVFPASLFASSHGTPTPPACLPASVLAHLEANSRDRRGRDRWAAPTQSRAHSRAERSSNKQSSGAQSAFIAHGEPWRAGASRVVTLMGHRLHTIPSLHEFSHEATMLAALSPASLETLEPLHLYMYVYISGRWKSTRGATGGGATSWLSGPPQ